MRILFETPQAANPTHLIHIHLITFSLLTYKVCQRGIVALSAKHTTALA